MFNVRHVVRGSGQTPINKKIYNTPSTQDGVCDRYRIRQISRHQGPREQIRDTFKKHFYK